MWSEKCILSHLKGFLAKIGKNRSPLKCQIRVDSLSKFFKLMLFYWVWAKSVFKFQVHPTFAWILAFINTDPEAFCHPSMLWLNLASDEATIQFLKTKLFKTGTIWQSTISRSSKNIKGMSLKVCVLFFLERVLFNKTIFL